MCSSGAITLVYTWCEQEFPGIHGAVFPGIHCATFKLSAFSKFRQKHYIFSSQQWKNIKGDEAGRLICSQYVLLSSSLSPWSSVQTSPWKTGTCTCKCIVPFIMIWETNWHLWEVICGRKKIPHRGKSVFQSQALLFHTSFYNFFF